MSGGGGTIPYERSPAPVALPPRPADGHKGTFGTVVVVGGSATMPGAAAMAARAAFRGGAGLVKVVAEQAVLDRVLAIEPSATGVASGERLDAGGVIEALRAADPDGRAVLAVGPGLGRSAEAILPAVSNDTRPLVLDADGLNALAASGRRLRRRAPSVLTPHPGECRRLADALQLRIDPTDPATRPEVARRLAEMHEAVFVLKGAGTVVSDGQRTYVNDTGNVAMATAGMGDVLTGVTAALLAAGMPAYDAACLAVWLHGAAGDLWAHRHWDRGLLARDLADLLPYAFRLAAKRAPASGDAQPGDVPSLSGSAAPSP
ncbi:MAG: NAD(P)H-hydrate dehydratase [Planctomycetota bacterium]